MPTPAERQAFLYLALVTAVGTAVRGWETRTTHAGAGEARALAAQLAAVDSALAQRAGARHAGRRAPTVPGRPMAPGRAPSMAPSEARVGPVDADRADSAALEALPGIGPALAARIVADREARGPFGSVAGLERVAGIGPGMTRRLAGLVTFSGVPRPPVSIRASDPSRRSP